MRGNGEALDVALGLLRAPAMRGTLRRRPLPSGVGEVLAIASGSAEGARVAAERTGYDAGELLEAARFYVQQVLLVEGADAYRVLGASRGADAATLRDNHRLLMRWLHPDRNEGAQWDSALSTRVNQAWNHVRTDAVRAEYDASLDAAAAEDGSLVATSAAFGAPEGSDGADVRVARTRGFASLAAGDARQGRPWQSHTAPATVALLGVLCLVLVWLAINREDNFDDIRSELTATAPHAPAQPLGSRRMKATLPNELLEVSTRQQRTFQGNEVGAPTPVSTPAPVPVTAGTTATATATALEPATDPATAPTLAPTSASGSAPISAPTPASTPASTPIPVGAAIAATLPTTPASSTVTRPPATPRNQTPPTTPAPTRRNTAAATIDWTPADIHTATPAASPPPSQPTRPGTEDPLHLLLQAEETLRGITRYLATQGGPEPLWLDLPASLEGAGIRTQLRERHLRAPQRMQIESPNWTLDTHTASMTGAYRLDSRRDTIETGVLRLDLTRRDQQWRIHALRLEPAR